MTQIYHTPDSGLFLRSQAMAVNQVRDLAQVAKIVVRGILGVARRIRRLPPFGLRRPSRAWRIGKFAI
jgi:hypothetical protein